MKGQGSLHRVQWNG